MTLEHLKTSTRTSLTVKLILTSGIIERYQNLIPSGSYTFEGEVYNYAPINYSGSQRSLEFDNAQATIVLPNYPTIASTIWQNDGLRKATVIVTEFFPDNSNVNPIRDLLTVKSSKFTLAEIEIQLQSIISAVGAVFPNKYYRTGGGGGDISIVGLIPEVPRSSRVI